MVKVLYCILCTVFYILYVSFIIWGKIVFQSLSFIATMADCGKASKQPGKQCESNGEYVEAQKARKKYEELRAKDGPGFM